MEGSPIERLPSELLEIVFSGLTWHMKTLCTMTRWRWREILKVREGMPYHYTKTDRQLITYAIEIGSISQTRMAITLQKMNHKKSYSRPLKAAAEKGNIEIIKLLKTRGETHYTKGIMRTLREELPYKCEKLVKGWSEYVETIKGELTSMSALGGHVECMKYVRKWETKEYEDLDRVLEYAARGGNPECMKLAKKWGATNFEHALVTASQYNHPKCVKLVEGWGEFSVEQYNSILFDAAYYGNIECMKRAKKWGATNFGDAIYNASSRINAEGMVLAKRRGVIRALSMENAGAIDISEHRSINYDVKRCIVLLKQWKGEAVVN